ncbi:MAG: hypothetical protein WAW61_14375 [Methylococcaceae bacterium]
MNIIELRKHLRRSSVTQRTTDRRKVPYEFGSPEWMEFIKRNHLDRPKFNRRKEERRSDKRLLPDRRQQLAESGRSEKKYARIFLTPAERKLLEDLYLSDLD